MSVAAGNWNEPKLIVDNDDALASAGNQRDDTPRQTAPSDTQQSVHAPTWQATSPWRYRVLMGLLAIAIVVTAGLVLVLKFPSIGSNPSFEAPALSDTATGSPSLPGAARQAGAAPARAGTITPAQDTPTATAVAPLSQANPTTEPASLALPMEIVNGYAAIKVLEARFTQVVSQLQELSAEVQSLSTTDEDTRRQLASIHERLRKRSVARTVRASSPVKPVAIAPLAAVVNAASTAAPQLVAVDSWNGRPSVSVNRGGAISFLALGDATADGLVLHSADPATQQAVFVLPSGETISARLQP